MSERGLVECNECHGSGQRVSAYTNAGGKVTVPCQPCRGSGFLPTMRGNIISWKNAYGILDRETATPVVQHREQGALL